ncbi:MAG: hypothetical protein Fur006_16990 [Coleofasciculaceae cyanobacterium]|jgi:hypothetical protein
MTITIKTLMNMSQVELDELYKKSSVGKIPEGEGKGTALFLFGLKVGEVFAPIIHLIAWQGKIFHPEQNLMINRATPFRIELLKAQIYKGNSLLGDGEAIIVDYSKTSIFTPAKDEIREVAPGIYLGHALWGKMRLTMFALEF